MSDGVGGLVERLKKHGIQHLEPKPKWFINEHDELDHTVEHIPTKFVPDADCQEAVAALQSLTAERDRLAEILSRPLLADWAAENDALAAENERLTTDDNEEINDLLEIRDRLRERAERAEARIATLTLEIGFAEAEKKNAEARLVEAGKVIEESSQALSHAYYLVIGKSPVWSADFSTPQALEEIGEVMTLLRCAFVNAQTNTAELMEKTEKMLGEVIEVLEGEDVDEIDRELLPQLRAFRVSLEAAPAWQAAGRSGGETSDGAKP